MLKTKKNKKNYKIRILSFALFAMFFASIFLFEEQVYSFVNKNSQTDYQNIMQSDLLVHYVDVGQGDAIAVTLPDGKKLLIDSGPRSSSDTLINYLNNVVFSAQEKVFEYFIITHPHEDHIGGSVDVFESYQVNNFYRPAVYTTEEIEEFELEFGVLYAESLHSYDTNIFESMISSADAEPNCQETIFSYIDIPMIISGADYTITFYSPISVTVSNVNNFSPMIVLEYQGKKFLFTGDAESEVEEDFLNTFITFADIDVLKVGHHGSSSSTTQDFLDATSPDFAIISVGKNNTYNHPTEAVLQRLADNNIQTYRTDLNGNILAGVLDGDIMIYQTLATSLPIVIEVWQVYFAGCVLVFYFVMTVNLKKIKIK